MNVTEKPKSWILPRHRAVRDLLYFPIWLYCRLAYGLRAEKFREQGDRAYLVLYNHQTPFDQFFVGLSFAGPVYYMATEDIFSLGWISSLIRWLVNPIPIKKQTTDINAVKTCIRVAGEGGTIAIAPEGNRTYSGKTEYMNPAIAGLAKKLGMPIALYRIEGGYGVEPRWSDVIRRGRIRGYVSRVIEPEELSAMTKEELAKQIETGLYVNEAAADGIFRSGKRAEYLERAVYVCPFCGLSKFESRGNSIRCTTCGREILYGEDKRLTGAGFQFPFAFVSDWYEYQKDYVNSLDVTVHREQPLFRDRANISEVIVYKRKNPLRSGASIALYGDRIVIDEGTETEWVLPFEELSAVTVLGRNKLNIYCGKQVWQLKGNKRFNALKYVHIYHRHKNIIRGDINGKFLGL